MNTENTPVRSRTTEMKIGKMTYIVTAHYKENARETAEQKLLRYVSERVAEAMQDRETAANACPD